MKGICSDDCVDDTIKMMMMMMMMMIIVISFAVYYDIDCCDLDDDNPLSFFNIDHSLSSFFISYFNTYYHLNVANEMIEEYDLSYKGIFIMDTCDCFCYILINGWIFFCLTFISPS